MIIAALPNKVDEPTALTSTVGSPAILAHSAKTLCSNGHRFREVPDDTPCISCKIQKDLDIKYGISVSIPLN